MREFGRGELEEGLVFARQEERDHGGELGPWAGWADGGAEGCEVGLGEAEGGGEGDVAGVLWRGALALKGVAWTRFGRSLYLSLC